jgi:hypothetical protein
MAQVRAPLLGANLGHPSGVLWQPLVVLRLGAGALADYLER